MSYRVAGWSDDPVTSDFGDVYTSRQDSGQVFVMQDLQDWIDVLGEDTGCKCEKCVCTPCQDDRLRVLRAASEEIVRLQAICDMLATRLRSGSDSGWDDAIDAWEDGREFGDKPESQGSAKLSPNSETNVDDTIINDSLQDYADYLYDLAFNAHLTQADHETLKHAAQLLLKLRAAKQTVAPENTTPDTTDWKNLAKTLLEANSRHLDDLDELKRLRGQLHRILYLFEEHYECPYCELRAATYLATCTNPLHYIHDVYIEEHGIFRHTVLDELRQHQTPRPTNLNESRPE